MTNSTHVLSPADLRLHAIRQRCQLILSYAEAAEQTFQTAEAALRTAQQASALTHKMIAKVREIDTILSSPMDDRDFVIEVAADLVSGPPAARISSRPHEVTRSHEMSVTPLPQRSGE
jgi:predicted RNase H-like nuclease